LQAIAQNGLLYAQDPFDRERYEQVRSVAAEIAAAGADAAVEPVLGLFAGEAGYATPKVDVRGVVFRDGQLLLVRGSDDGLWTVPGGWAEVGERPSEAVEKEVHEESGYAARAVKLIGVQDRRFELAPFHIYKLFFRCELAPGKPATPAAHEIDAVGFFGEHDLPELSRRAGQKGLAWVFEHLRDPQRAADFD
jgi:ADP-ribose pyrophosphatase YjhB (NUDIX family)